MQSVQAAKTLVHSLRVLNFASAEIALGTLSLYVAAYGANNLQLLQFRRLSQGGKAVVRSIDNVRALMQPYVRIAERVQALAIKQLQSA